MKLDIKYQGKELSLPITPWDMVAWEDFARLKKWPMKPDAPDFPPSKYTYFLAYSACKRLNYCPRETDYYDWLADIDSVNEDETEDEADFSMSGPVAP